MSQPLPLDRIARTVLASAHAVVPGHFHATAVTPAEYPHIDWAAYDEARRRLEAHGFRHLGDIHPTSEEASSMARPSVLRMLASADGAVTACFYKLALRWTPLGIMARLLGGAGGMLDLVSVYPDGTIVETSSAMAASTWDDPPFLLREYRPRGTPVDELVARHHERLRAHAGPTPSLSPVRVNTLLEVIAASDATERAKRAWRQRIGWISRGELARFSKLSGPQLDELEDIVRRMAAAESSPAPVDLPPVLR